MTMIAACHFQNGAVIIADSRVTWDLPDGRVLSDRAQKILPLGSKLAIAFAGNVDVAERIVREVRKRLAKNARLRIPDKLALYLPRVARHFYQSYTVKKSLKYSVALVLGGVDISGRVSLWTYESPMFGCREVREGFAVVGSGSIVASYLEKNYERIKSTREDLKDLADALILGLASELQKSEVVTVGGLFQVIILSSKGISPVTHGFIELTPADPGNAKHMDMRAGKWVQIDSAKRKEIELIEPARILASSPEEMRFHDYELPATGKTTLRWYLSYFLTCLIVKRDIDLIEFEGVVSQIGCFHYPMRIPILASLGFWGPAGDHELIFRLNVYEKTRTLYKRTVSIEYFPEQVEVDTTLFLEINSPGPAFLECYIDNQLLARKALYFGVPSETIPKTKEEYKNLIKEYPRKLIEQHRKYTDPVLQKKNCILEYFILCREAIYEEGKYQFSGEMRAVYWKSYPLPLKLLIATAFRLSKGNHNIRMDLVNAATHETSKVASAVVVPTADCIVTPIHGEVIVRIPKPSIYCFNLYVDDQFISSIILPAETNEPRYSYSLIDEDSKRVASGELLALAKRSQQIKQNSSDRSSHYIP